MTAKEQLDALLRKLASPYWTPLPTQNYLSQSQHHVATFNMYFVLRGRPSHHLPGDITRNTHYWTLAKRVCNLSTPQGPISDSVLVTTPAEFWEKVVMHKQASFERFLPMKEWNRLLNDNSYNQVPAPIEGFGKAVEQ